MKSHNFRIIFIVWSIDFSCQYVL